MFEAGYTRGPVVVWLFGCITLGVLLYMLHDGYYRWLSLECVRALPALVAMGAWLVPANLAHSGQWIVVVMLAEGLKWLVVRALPQDLMGWTAATHPTSDVAHLFIRT